MKMKYYTIVEFLIASTKYITLFEVDKVYNKVIYKV